MHHIKSVFILKSPVRLSAQKAVRWQPACADVDKSSQAWHRTPFRCTGRSSTLTTCGRSWQSANWRGSASRTPTCELGCKGILQNVTRCFTVSRQFDYRPPCKLFQTVVHSFTSRRATQCCTALQTGGQGPGVPQHAAAEGDARLPGGRLPGGCQPRAPGVLPSWLCSCRSQAQLHRVCNLTRERQLDACCR